MSPRGHRRLADRQRDRGRALRIGDVDRRVGIEDHRRAHDAQRELCLGRKLDPADTARNVRRLLLGRRRGRPGVAELVDHESTVVGVRRDHHPHDEAWRSGQARGLGRSVGRRDVLELQALSGQGVCQHGFRRGGGGAGRTRRRACRRERRGARGRHAARRQGCDRQQCNDDGHGDDQRPAVARRWFGNVGRIRRRRIAGDFVGRGLGARGRRRNRWDTAATRLLRVVRRSRRPLVAHPGGHSNGRPPIRWKWRWSTD